MLSLTNIIFLAFICIIAGVLMSHVEPSSLFSMLLVAGVCLWVISDYYKTKKLNMLDDHHADQSEHDQSEHDQSEHDQSEHDQSEHDEHDHHADQLQDLNPHRRPDDKFDIHMYNNHTIPELHRQMGCSVDNQMANRLRYMQLQPKMSAIARARYNADTARPFFEAELRANETRDWWDNENDYLDEFM
jgi:ABC-type Zn2+ transport system substrate-binding protein/surface adhesin